jgi:hypothetical protein|tara:strand:+ start:520 stop:627 length:108 start_codon:yes stop_codon:yes gene_type:complete
MAKGVFKGQETKAKQRMSSLPIFAAPSIDPLIIIP